MEPRPTSETDRLNQEFERVTDDILIKLASRFPVCTSSDEFHFFPQIPPGPSHWSRWDDFSAESIFTFGSHCQDWMRRLNALEAALHSKDQRIDIRLMRRMLTTLNEQLTVVAPHRKQPTLYLTIVGIGLAEAIETGASRFKQRLKGVPGFLLDAEINLSSVPALFNRMGQTMAQNLSAWLRALPVEDEITRSARTALGRFATHLHAMPVDERFLLPIEVYERIATEHIGTRVSTAELEAELASEQETVSRLLRRHAAQIDPSAHWRDVVAGLKHPWPGGRPTGPFRRATDALAAHCVAQGLMPAVLPQTCPVRIETIPEYMTPIRSSAAFSAVAGHPARGGTFYIVDDAVPADYRLLTAHETYPGHHLLDTCRWNHSRNVRRHLEFPLFYEGWASFSEELMFATGFFSGPADGLLLAKRRFWRALRGRVDLNIHMRRQSLKSAAAFLVTQGMAPSQARATVARYALKPGYQLSYTIGRRRFRRLYAQCQGPGKAKHFARRILSQGEIEFDELETLLMQGGER